MGSMSDKASGLANQAAGNMKQGIGKLVGNERLQAEGASQEAKGDIQQATGNVKAAIKENAQKVTDKIKEVL